MPTFLRMCSVATNIYRMDVVDMPITIINKCG